MIWQSVTAVSTSVENDDVIQIIVPNGLCCVLTLFHLVWSRSLFFCCLCSGHMITWVNCWPVISLCRAALPVQLSFSALNGWPAYGAEGGIGAWRRRGWSAPTVKKCQAWPSPSQFVRLHRESKKGYNHGYNFVNSWWICKILSLVQRALNFQQNQY